MVVIRTSQGTDKKEYEELQKLASKGISEDELEEVVAEYEEEDQKKIDAKESYEVMRERYKQEKAQENFNSGKGFFKRSDG